MITKWDERFLEMAKLVASWSKDPSTKTGAVMVDAKRRIISVGYNGFSSKDPDREEDYNNREVKYKRVVHCERNSLIFAQRSVEGGTLYTYPFMSCAPCAAMMIQAGIIRVVAPYDNNPRWIEDFKLSSQMFDEAGVRIDLVGGPVGGYLR